MTRAAAAATLAKIGHAEYHARLLEQRAADLERRADALRAKAAALRGSQPAKGIEDRRQTPGGGCMAIGRPQGR